MSPRYNFSKLKDGSYNFISEQGHNYLVYFSESTFPDAENNTHIVSNLGFYRNGKHSNESFVNKFDERIRATIMFIVNDFFEKNDHKAIIYFCFGDDGFSRQRNIIFNKWSKDLDTTIEKHNNNTIYKHSRIYASLLIVKDNPLKKLITDAFNSYLKEINDSE